MNFVGLVLLVFMFYSANLSANTFIPKCQASIYFDPQIGEPVDSSIELEPALGEKSYTFDSLQNLLDYQLIYHAEFNFLASPVARPSGAVEIALTGGGSDTPQIVRRDIHHTEFKSDAKFEVVILPDGYNGLHYAKLSCVLEGS